MDSVGGVSVRLGGRGAVYLHGVLKKHGFGHTVEVFRFGLVRYDCRGEVADHSAARFVKDFQRVDVGASAGGGDGARLHGVQVKSYNFENGALDGACYVAFCHDIFLLSPGGGFMRPVAGISPAPG